MLLISLSNNLAIKASLVKPEASQAVLREVLVSDVTLNCNLDMNKIKIKTSVGSNAFIIIG
jgi:hypothetical protein